MMSTFSLQKGGHSAIMDTNYESNKVNAMRRMIALALSLLLLLTVAVGCNEEAPEEITDDRICADLVKQSGKYAFAHVVGTPDITAMQVLHCEETSNNTSLEVTATAIFDNAEVAFGATIHYRLDGKKWRLHSMDVSKKEVTLTGAPDKDSLLEELTNYTSVYGSAMAQMDEEFHNLVFRPQDADWELLYEKDSKTATLAVSYSDESLTFAGSYTLTFGESGWFFESVERIDGRHHPLLRLTTLTQK